MKNRKRQPSRIMLPRDAGSASVCVLCISTCFGLWMECYISKLKIHFLLKLFPDLSFTFVFSKQVFGKMTILLIIIIALLLEILYG